MHILPNTAPVKFDLFQIHKSFGLSILALSVIRLGWRLGNAAPPLPEAMPGWQVIAARGTHWLFYFLMLATPLVGLAIVSVSPKDIPTVWFGLFAVPHLGFIDPGANPAATEHQFIELHEKLSYAILGLLALHIAAAFKHGFVNRDGVLRSMAPSLGAIFGVAVIFIAMGGGVARYFASKAQPADIAPIGNVDAVETARPDAPPVVEPSAGASPAEPVSPEDAAPAQSASPALIENKFCNGAMALSPNWRVDPAGGALRFMGAQSGQSFAGTFGRFSAEIAFDENNLDKSWLHVSVQTATAATGDALIDSTLPGREWFNVKAFGVATFTACNIRRTGTGEYEARGALAIKGVSKDITLPFVLTIDGDRASAAGGVDLIRTDFELGAAPSWLADEGVALEARAEFSISATRVE